MMNGLDGRGEKELEGKVEAVVRELRYCWRGIGE